MFKAIFSFEGRIRRMEYCLTYLAYIIFSLLLDYITGDTLVSYSPLVYLALIPAWWILIAQGAKRCHDRDNSGWFQLIPFYFLWMFFADSVPGENGYGPNPKGIGNNDDIAEIGNYLEQPTV